MKHEQICITEKDVLMNLQEILYTNEKSHIPEKEFQQKKRRVGPSKINWTKYLEKVQKGESQMSPQELAWLDQIDAPQSSSRAQNQTATSTDLYDTGVWDTGSADAKASLHETKRLQVEYKSISDEVRQLNQRIQHGVRSPGESESDYYARRGQTSR